ncbi:MAG: SDR family oxidoreductase [Traorella sp.]
MNTKDLFGFEGKNVVISGAASGMSKAATELLLELGANVYAVDINPIDLPVKEAYRVDMGNKEEIDAWLTKLPKTIDALFLCHGVAGFAGKELNLSNINFYSQKYITEALLDRITDKGSITYIGSAAAFGWEQNYKKIMELMNINDWQEAQQWYMDNFDLINHPNAYGFSKQCLMAYVTKKASDPAFINRKIRINAINPGETKTGLTKYVNLAMANGDEELGAKMTHSVFLDSWNGYPAQPEDMGYPLVVLGSKICSYVSGQGLYIDYGVTSMWKTTALDK